ncbi:MAG: adenylate/guanylate cyclase domain-containing protein [Flavobacteriales bacterium]|nr:adenylate/guanylate cyclase domain-containing protein [Flavobacteriales bacterium]
MEFAQQMFADSVAKAEEARMVEAAHTEEIRKKNRTRNYMALGGLGLFVVALGFYSRSRYMRRSRDIISKERDRSENLLLNILPAEIAAELKEKGRAEARDFEMVSILFTDFKGFTQASEKMSAAELVREINTCFEAFDSIVGRHGIEKIKTIGDAYMAAGGLPVPDVNAARNTVLAGLEMQAFMKVRKAERDAQSLPAFEMRVGIHTGPVVAGIVGVKKFQYDIWGDTVNTASRMESSGEVGQVNISEATYRMVVSSPLSVAGHTDPRTLDSSDGQLTTENRQLFIFTPRGKVQAKGKGEMEMYFVERS